MLASIQFPPYTQAEYVICWTGWGQCDLPAIIAVGKGFPWGDVPGVHTSEPGHLCKDRLSIRSCSRRMSYEQSSMGVSDIAPYMVPCSNGEMEIERWDRRGHGTNRGHFRRRSRITARGNQSLRSREIVPCPTEGAWREGVLAQIRLPYRLQVTQRWRVTFRPHAISAFEADTGPIHYAQDSTGTQRWGAGPTL